MYLKFHYKNVNIKIKIVYLFIIIVLDCVIFVYNLHKINLYKNFVNWISILNSIMHSIQLHVRYYK